MMKKALFSLVLLFFSFLKSWAGEPTQAKIAVRYLPGNRSMEVLAIFNAEGPISLGTSVITVVLPGSAPDKALTANANGVAFFADLSQNYAVDGKDYHGFVTTGTSLIPYENGKLMKLFEFEVPGGVDHREICLWMAASDRAETADGTDYVHNFYIPHSGYYIIPEPFKFLEPERPEVDPRITCLYIYPNPAPEFLHIEICPNFNAEDVSFEVWTVDAKIMWSKTVDFIKDQKLVVEIPCANWAQTEYVGAITLDGAILAPFEFQHIDTK